MGFAGGQGWNGLGQDVWVVGESEGQDVSHSLFVMNVIVRQMDLHERTCGW